MQKFVVLSCEKSAYIYRDIIKDIFNSTTQVWSATPESEHFRLKTLPHLGKLFDLRGLNIDLLPATWRFPRVMGLPQMVDVGVF
jgi:hypothetical protein